MLNLTDRDAVTAALTDTSLDASLDVHQKALLALRLWQLDDDRSRPLGEFLQIVVVQPGDTPEVIHEAVGFPICWDQAEQPGYEWLEDHGHLYEIAYVLTDAFAMLLLVPDQPGVNDTLLFNCRAVSNRPGPLENKP
jgi:hypothetical protein